MTCWVLVVGLPPAAGCAPGRTWRTAASFVRERLVHRFGDRVAFEYAELFSPDMIRHPDVEADIAAGHADLPVVVIDGVRRFSGGKLNVGAISREVAAVLGTASTPRTGSARPLADPADFTSTTEGRVS